MPRYSIDTVLRLRLKHRPGQFARLAAAIADGDGLIGEVATLSIGEEDVLREVTIETHDEAHTNRVVEAVRAVVGVEVQSVTDRVFDCHRGGKVRQRSVSPVRNIRDLRQIYTPGVARVATAIQKDAARAWEWTGIGNSVGIFTNGTRVLGLGDIGPLASMPVMEGKAVLYDQLAGVSAVPILIDTKDPNLFIETVLRVATTFAGIHLEDIRAPDCFIIEESLRAKLAKPVLHDDQHGTATVALAAVINACKITGIDIRNARVGQIGLGAAGSAIATLVARYGVGQVLVTDTSEAAMSRVQVPNVRRVSFDTILREADIVIAATGRGDLISQNSIQRGQVILALSNPSPEILPEKAIDAGAALASDGRFINNALAYPGLFRGTLEARSRTIAPEMLIAAAEAIAARARSGELLPDVLDRSCHDAVTAAVRQKAEALGLGGTLCLA